MIIIIISMGEGRPFGPRRDARGQCLTPLPEPSPCLVGRGFGAPLEPSLVPLGAFRHVPIGSKVDQRERQKGCPPPTEKRSYAPDLGAWVRAQVVGA